MPPSTIHRQFNIQVTFGGRKNVSSTWQLRVAIHSTHLYATPKMRNDARMKKQKCEWPHLKILHKEQ